MRPFGEQGAKTRRKSGEKSGRPKSQAAFHRLAEAGTLLLDPLQLRFQTCHCGIELRVLFLTKRQLLFQVVDALLKPMTFFDSPRVGRGTGSRVKPLHVSLEELHVFPIADRTPIGKRRGKEIEATIHVNQRLNAIAKLEKHFGSAILEAEKFKSAA